jgi:hypothetical protein
MYNVITFDKKAKKSSGWCQQSAGFFLHFIFGLDVGGDISLKNSGPYPDCVALEAENLSLQPLQWEP